MIPATLDGNRQTALSATVRPATVADADAMAQLIDMAGEGLPMVLWSAIAAPGQDPRQIGRERAARAEGAFSYRNAFIAEADGRAAGCLVGYRLPDQPESVDPASTPPVFVPLLRLEACAAGSWYVNALAVFEEARCQGHASRLMAVAEAETRRTNAKGTSLIVADANVGARRLYAGLGYREIAAEPMVKGDWPGEGQNWLLCVKSG
jgi:ribosomal protein S18 acetylase RimI-like enzyme